MAAAPTAEVAARWEPAEPAEPAETRLARLAAAVGPLRRVLAALAGRLVTTRAWERLCYARLGDYARERVGQSARQLQELARVHRALTGLPRLERALLSNELPWSKVRLVARVATPEDEAEWIARARAAPTRDLERLVRDRARSPTPEEVDEAEPETRLAVRCTPAAREKWLRAREMAERVAGERLRAGDALECVVAEVFSAISIDPAFVETPPGVPVGRAAAEGPPVLRTGRVSTRAPAPPPPEVLAGLTAGIDEADPFELDRRLRLAIRLEQTLDAAMAPLLRRVSASEYEWRNGLHRPLATYARDELGMSASKARTLLRLERAGDVCPELRRAYRAGSLSWAKARVLLPLLELAIEGEWRPAWVAWAERVTVRRLEQDVERALLLRAAHPLAWRRCQRAPEHAQDPIPEAEQHLCAREVDPEATERLAWRVPRSVAALFHGVWHTLRARLRTRAPGEVFDVLLDCALVAWSARDPHGPRPDPVIERDRYRCAVPGCSSRRNLHDHHVVFRSAGGSDAPENRITLCAFHHQRCLHAGLLRLRGRAPDGLVFELGVRRGAPPLVRYRSGDLLLPQPLGTPSFTAVPYASTSVAPVMNSVAS
jgi:hypothetical protein